MGTRELFNMGDEHDDKPTLFIETGSCNIRAGLVGEGEDADYPTAQLNNCIGYPTRATQGVKLRMNPVQTEHYVGEECQAKRGILSLEWPMKKGIIKTEEEQEAMIKIWQHLIDAKASVNLDSSNDDDDCRGVFLSEAPMTSKRQQEWVCETWFNTFNVRNYFVSVSAVLGLYSQGKDSGLGIDSGDGTTHAVPMWEGYNISSAVRRMPLAGRDLTEYMERLLAEDSYTLTSSAERISAMNMKGGEANKEPPALNVDYYGGYVALCLADELEKVEMELFRLPDSSTIEVCSQRVRVPELLFNPELDGHEMDSLASAANKAQLAAPVDCRNELLSKVYLFGGNCAWKEHPNDEEQTMQARFKQDMELLEVLGEVKAFQPPDGVFCQLVGAGQVARMSTFPKFTIEKSVFTEKGGGRVVHEYCGF